MAFTNDWTVTDNPADHSKFKNQPSYVRKVRTDLEERLASQCYGFTSGETDTGFKKMLLKDQAGDISTPGSGFLGFFAKTVSSSLGLYFKNAAGTVYQIITGLGGSLSGALNEYQGADIPSVAGTTDIGAATGNYVHVTGTETITGLGTVQAGTRRIVKFTGALILTYNATSLILPGGANITTAANDRATFVSLGSGNWICTDFVKASGAPILAALPKGYINLASSFGNNASDVTNDLDIPAIQCRDASNAYNITTIALIKRVDATFTAGTNQGAWDTGSVGAAKLVYVWAIGKSTDTSAGDILYSASSSSPTMPSGWDTKRLVFGLYWSGSAFVKFYQDGDFVYFDERISILDTNSASTSFADVDVSAYVPVNIGAIVVNGKLIDSASGGGSQQWYFRRNGSSATNGTIEFTSLNSFAQWLMPVDSSRIFEYKSENASRTIKLDLAGFNMRGLLAA